MKSGLVLVMLTSLSANALAQQEAKFEFALGIGTDMIYSSTPFKNDHNLSASFCYGLSDQWGVALYLGQQDYSLNGLTSQNQRFLGGKTPDVKKIVTSLLMGGRYFIANKSKTLGPYVAVALGYAKSASSAEGYYVEDLRTRIQRIIE